jgi:ribonuclease HI
MNNDEDQIVTCGDRIVAVYADGGVVDANPSPFGGVWAWCAVDEHDERIVRRSGFVPNTETHQMTNNNTEIIALVKALEALPDGWSGLVCSDSKIALGTLFWGYNARKQPACIVKRGMAAVARLGTIETMLLQGHPTKEDLCNGIGKKRKLPVSKHNVWCDKQCNLEKKLWKKRQAHALTKIQMAARQA